MNLLPNVANLFERRLLERLLPTVLLSTLLTIPASCGYATSTSNNRHGDTLAREFTNPPAHARPRAWWHWMNGNISKAGIREDLAWMKRAGLGGFQNFDASLATPQIVDQRLIYMTPPWQEALRFAASQAAELDLEMAIATSPGWSQTGGPWVKPENGIKKLVWSETLVTGGTPFKGMVSAPPAVTGPFQSIQKDSGILSSLAGDKGSAIPAFYDDVAVFAYPVSDAELPQPMVVTVNDKSVSGAALFDADFGSAIDVPRGKQGEPGTVVIDYGKKVTAQAARFFAPGLGGNFYNSPIELQLATSNDGKQWQPLTAVHPKNVPYTVSFAPTEARFFRLQFVVTGQFNANLWTPPAPGADLSFLKRLSPVKEGAQIDKLAEFRLIAEPKVDHFELKAGFALVHDYYTLDSTDGDPSGGVTPEEVIDLTHRLQSDGTLEWTPPEGHWRIVRLGYSLTGTTNHPAPPEATGLEVDKLDSSAVRDYLETYLSMYRETVGDALMGEVGLQALLSDSTEVLPFNWTAKFPEHFKRLRGYDIRPWLPVLTGAVIGSRRQSDAFLYDFRRTIAELHASEHYGTVAQVAHEQGLKVYGESLEGHRPTLGNDMAMRSYADVPMAALWTFDRGTKPKTGYLADIRGAASVAHIYGQNLVAAESMTSALQPWASSPADLKRVIDWEFASGVNLPVIHTSVHQPRDDKQPGLSLAVFGQHFNRHETWAEMARPWIDYMARNSYLLQQGRFVADVAYFYGEEAPLLSLFGNEPTRYAYDFINDEAVLKALSVTDGKLTTPGGARYEVLYLGGSSKYMTLPVLRRLHDLVTAGATVVGEPPLSSPSLADNPEEFRRLVAQLWSGNTVNRIGKGHVIASTDIEAALKLIGLTADFDYHAEHADSDIAFVHRRLDNAEVYFLSNRNNRPEQITAHFRVSGKRPELWDPVTGTAKALSYRIDKGVTTVPLKMKAEDAFFVVFREPAQKTAMTVAETSLDTIAELSGPWQVAFQADRGAPASIELDSLKSLSEHNAPGVKYFSGTASYRRSFALPDTVQPGQSVLLDLGAIGDVAEVWINGHKAGIAWLPPYQVDIGKHLRPGENQLEIRVANLWVNRLIGDAQPGAGKVTWTVLPTYTPQAPLRPAGLIGPVSLLAPE